MSGFYEDSFKRAESMIMDLSIELAKYQSRYEFLRDYDGDIDIWYESFKANVTYDLMVDILIVNNTK